MDITAFVWLVSFQNTANEWQDEEKYQAVGETVSSELFPDMDRGCRIFKWNLMPEQIGNRANKTKRKQAFLDGNPKNFSRIFYEYTGDNKGFVNWKGQLEELLF